MLKLNMYFGFVLQSSTCSFLSMQGELTHIQGFLQITNNVEMFYPQNKSVPSIETHWTLANLDATSAYICLIFVNFCKLLRIECNFFTCFLEFVLLPLAVNYLYSIWYAAEVDMQSSI